METKGSEDGIGALTTLTVAVLFSGAAFVLVNSRVGRCAGARRSVRLQFQQRQQAVAAAVEERKTATSPAPDTVTVPGVATSAAENP
jgi:hypothetical protein